MSIIEAIILGAIEGVTEFLPVSSTGHLTIAEDAMGFNIDDADITAFTAIVQVGAIAAALIYFWNDLLEDRHRARRRDRRCGSPPDARLPLRARGRRSARSRSRLWASCSETRSRTTCATSGSSRVALIAWSFVMYAADQSPTQRRHEDDFNMRDAVVMGLTQCVALIPGRLALGCDDRRRASSAASTG